MLAATLFASVPWQLWCYGRVESDGTTFEPPGRCSLSERTKK